MREKKPTKKMEIAKYVQSVTEVTVHPLKQTKQTKRFESSEEVRRISSY